MTATKTRRRIVTVGDRQYYRQLVKEGDHYDVFDASIQEEIINEEQGAIAILSQNVTRYYSKLL